jgi:hypothetical protein
MSARYAREAAVHGRGKCTHVGLVKARRGTHTRTSSSSRSYTVMCTPYVTTPNSAHAERSIENTYPLAPRGASSTVRGSCPSVRSAPPGASYTSYHSARQRDPPITPANADALWSPSRTPLAAARQRSRVSASASVRAAGVPRARGSANAMYGGGGGCEELSLSLLGECASGLGMSHARGWSLALRQALSARRAATTGGRRRPRAGRVFWERRNGTRCSGERCGRKLSQAMRTFIRLFSEAMVASRARDDISQGYIMGSWRVFLVDSSTIKIAGDENCSAERRVRPSLGMGRAVTSPVRHTLTLLLIKGRAFIPLMASL